MQVTVISIKPWRLPVPWDLPEPLEDVLVVTRLGCMDEKPGRDQAYRRKDGTWVLTGSDPELVITPLCWMPMPPIPQKFEEQMEEHD